MRSLLGRGGQVSCMKGFHVLDEARQLILRPGLSTRKLSQRVGEEEAAKDTGKTNHRVACDVWRATRGMWRRL